MYIKVRPMTGGSETVFTVSKLTKIEELRLIIQQKLAVMPEQQRLFFQGKQLVDGHTMFDYNINVNDVIQLMVRQVLAEATNRADSSKHQDTASSKHQDTASSKHQDTATSPTEQSRQKARRATNDGCASTSRHEASSSESSEFLEKLDVAETEYYRAGDLVDAELEGSWWEAQILSITPAGEEDHVLPPAGELTDNFLYHVRFERYGYEEPSVLRLQELRPRAYKTLQIQQLTVGDRVLANYNLDHPTQRGYWYHCQVCGTLSGVCGTLVPLSGVWYTVRCVVHWYHCQVEGVVEEGGQRTVVVGLRCGQEFISGCILAFPHEVLAIPDHVPVRDRLQPASSVRRETAPRCPSCCDRGQVRCVECGCRCCGGKQEPEKLLLCDECDKPYHIYCLQPPLPAVPDVDEWFCPACKTDETEIVRAGEKLKDSKKKAKMPSKRTECVRDWGKGFACVGRSKHCTIVPPHHFGHIPGVEVGTSWLFRIQVRAPAVLGTSWLFRIQASEAGVHRPPVSGIHGRGDEGAYSVVLAGGYEDDEDEGDEFTYTGAGGRDLSGNRRTAPQSSHQTLTKTNRALALNCNCKLTEEGGDAGEGWRGGRPIRVLRSYKGRRHSHYAPQEGIRYDGLYKVVRYWLETGKSGFKVWRYFLKRDDPSPAPWTEEGALRVRRLGLVMQLETMSNFGSRPTTPGQHSTISSFAPSAYTT
ncbi:SRA-YDG [Trinorchestia longiramus]|nr:SRA-YDG [Trinorchestia longiramus]